MHGEKTTKNINKVPCTVHECVCVGQSYNREYCVERIEILHARPTQKYISFRTKTKRRRLPMPCARRVHADSRLVTCTGETGSGTRRAREFTTDAPTRARSRIHST